MSEKEILKPLTEDISYFPPANEALCEPNGLLAIGGDLQPERLLHAYRKGIFPWYDEAPILWWCPSHRAVLFLDDLHISHSMKKTLKKRHFQIKMDENFTKVIALCASIREQTTGTWITPEMQAAYISLHEMGYAHSLEVYQENQLVGGIYGISLGKMFFGESMFSLMSNASKLALIYLVKQLKSWGFELIDCQVWNDHLGSLGAKMLSRHEFLQKVSLNNAQQTKVGKWTLEITL